ncbi:MAG: ATPase, T2SS/T4P/T4SS family [Gemmatimonadota bacterium]
MLGKLLVDDGAASGDLVETALAEQRETRERLGRILVRRGLDPETVARALARQLRLGYAAPPLAPAPEAVALLDRDHALTLRAVPLNIAGRLLRVAMADPLNASAIDDLQFRTGRRVEPVVATEATVERGLLAAYGEDAVRAVLGRLGGGPLKDAAGPAPPGPVADGECGGAEAEVLRQASEAPPIIALVNLFLDRAVSGGASDVHVEPARDRLVVRARLDGVLRKLLDVPASAAPAVVSRLKVMAGLDIAVKRRPQDGRSAVSVGGTRVGIRVSTLPAQDGEKVVLRLLDPRAAVRTLDDLGLEEPLRAGLDACLDRAHGLFLVTGPTGSGKTTTLYAALQSRDRAGRNIVTLEDPVEYRMEGVTQVQVQPRAGLTFAAALRAVLRQDPDIVMVGEMRDRETAETGLAAALTGHLVLATLHTNDAASAVTRLVEMGVARYLVAGGVTGVLAQRLVRRICPDCRTARPVTGDALHDLGLPTPTHLPAAPGCDRCDGTGYRGRVAIMELLCIDAPIRELILADAPVDHVREAAAAAGMVPLAVDAWRKVEAGLTTVDEVRPLLALLADEAPACGACGGRVAREHPFCPHCGGEVARRCDCGARTRPHWRFCGVCGARL